VGVSFGPFGPCAKPMSSGEVSTAFGVSRATGPRCLATLATPAEGHHAAALRSYRGAPRIRAPVDLTDPRKPRVSS
jgi:hypothetical protein